MKRLLFVLSMLLCAGLCAIPNAPATAQPLPVFIQGMNGGGGHNVMLKADGTVWTWGDNDLGQLGIGTLTDAAVPTMVALPPIKMVAAGQYYTIALAADGLSIYAFGDNAFGELGNGNNALHYSATPVQVALTLPAGTTITAIADGGNHGLALLSTGRVVAWGANEWGQCGQNPKTVGNVLYAPMMVAAFSGVQSLAGGDHHTLALKTDGTVWAWGWNKYGEIGPTPAPSPKAGAFKPQQVPGLANIALIATGGEDSLAVTATGSVYSFGRDKFGELGQGTTDPSDGPHPTATQVAGLGNIVSIDGEGAFTLAADSAGNIYSFGYNKDGELGNGGTTDSGTPAVVMTLPPSDTGAGPSVQVSAGHVFSFAFNAVTGATYSWGKNNSAELAFPANNKPNPLPADVTSAILGGVQLYAR